MTDLFPFNTLRVHARARRFIELNSPQPLPPDEPLLFLGGGANVLFTQDFPGTIAKINFSGIKVIKETATDILVEAAAGQNWHELVMWSCDHDLWGLQNMASIPGTVGAAALGNIAAYGGNQEDVFESLTTQNNDIFTKKDCQFSYRESFFKKNKSYLISSVRYRLSKNPHPDTSYHDRYTSLAAELAKIATPPYSAKDISRAVINIRQSKLPNMDQVGTAGSFFKNPLISKSFYLSLKSQVSDLQWYPSEKLSYHHDSQIPDIVKIPAGRLLDELGWKGRTIGRVSTSPNQALYVINLGGATGAEIYAYAEKMRLDIKKNFAIDLNYEIQII
ncbi:UDP-N-acetylmuramate dehydrogenase [Candidatus Amesbacteria bacterium]|nr:UDP-N-acetylmuramate dehydrogenase [Candidatus Amesbacteria bacterium]MBI2587521.1 UDP-N-acetylmuramate dehydrogenase [Candidatus Amesbacteria bacterium]